MLASAFILDQRLADLRSSDDDQRVARWRREASDSASPRVEVSRRTSLNTRVGQPARLTTR